ncbi:hypothetical protein Chor_001560 [Crotalus horridus]
MMPTPVILLKEGTDTSQGIPQLVSNISACQVIAEAVRTTLGPRGMDKLIVDDRGLLQKCAGTALSSKLISQHKEFFAKMVVDAVMMLDELLQIKMIGIKKVQGGALEDSQLVAGVAFKKTFSYAGFEMQPKKYESPKIALLNIELELKAERDNAEVRVQNVADYQAIVDAEWNILYDKLDKLHKSGAKVVLSKLPIGDVATQYFADRDMFCAGRACGGSIQSSANALTDDVLGRCALFEEAQIGGERYNFFTGCPKAKTCTIILRGGAEQIMEETERSLHDAIMIVRRAIKGGTWYGVDVNNEDIADNFVACVWEPAIVRINALTAASEAACLIVSVDETIKNPRSTMDAPPVGRGRGRGRPHNH